MGLRLDPRAHGGLGRRRQRHPPERRRAGDWDTVLEQVHRGETFDVEYEVTACEPPTRLDITSRAGPFPFDGSLRLTEVGDRTEVSNTIDAGSDSRATTVIFTLFGPVVRRLMRRQLADELDQLAAALDEGSPVAEAAA